MCPRHAVAILLTCAMLCIIPLAAYAHQKSDDSARLIPLPSPRNGISFGLHWDTDIFDNLDGGIKRGYATDSVLSLGFGLDTEKLGWWRGGQFTLGLQAIASTHPSEYAGDLQTLSNLDAPNRRQIAELWYAQSLGDATLVRAGIIDMNRFFDVTDTAGLFTNSSFGITPSISFNVPTSIYPNYGWGAMVQFGHYENGWLFGVFQGDPVHRSTVFKQGATLISERDMRFGTGGPQIGIGAWYRRAPATAGQPESDWGTYALLEQPLPAHPDTSVFAQFGASPGAVNAVPVYLGGGIVFNNVTPAVSDVGLGFARAWIRDHAAETSLEATALIPLSEGEISLQPDMQYILHPSGIHPNALVIGLRLHVTLY